MSLLRRIAATLCLAVLVVAACASCVNASVSCKDTTAAGKKVARYTWAVKNDSDHKRTFELRVFSNSAEEKTGFGDAVSTKNASANSSATFIYDVTKSHEGTAKVYDTAPHGTATFVDGGTVKLKNPC